MKYLIALLLIPLTGFGIELETESHIISIDSKCSEGEVSCARYFYTGTNKTTGEVITLQGSSWHTTCNDGVTPCRFVGYKFSQGNTTYWVHQDGLFEVIQNSRQVLISEQGQWK
ncbi:hypothetical protein [Spongorhabdus nitratireducens]